MLKLATKFKPDTQSFENATAAGFQNAEFWLGEEILADPRSTIELATGFDLGIGLHFPNQGQLEDIHLHGFCRLYQSLNCPSAVIHAPMSRRYSDRLQAIDSEMRIGVENHRLDSAGFWQWAETNRWLTLDVEHLWMFTLPGQSLDEVMQHLDEFLSKHVGQLVHVHLPGYLPGQDEHCPMYYSPDFVTRSLTLLAQHGYGGLVVSEVNAEHQVLAELRKDVALFKRWQRDRLQFGMPTISLNTPVSPAMNQQFS